MATSSYRLGRDSNMTQFTFESLELANGEIELAIDFNNVAQGRETERLSPTQRNITVNYTKNTIFGGVLFVRGTYRWDVTNQVIRYDGDLTVNGVAAVEFENCPILEIS